MPWIETGTDLYNHRKTMFRRGITNFKNTEEYRMFYDVEKQEPITVPLSRHGAKRTAWFMWSLIVYSLCVIGVVSIFVG